MNIGTRVEYQTDIGEYALGTVIGFDEESEIVTVTDDDDGSTWSGPVDFATPTDE